MSEISAGARMALERRDWQWLDRHVAGLRHVGLAAEADAVERAADRVRAALGVLAVEECPNCGSRDLSDRRRAGPETAVECGACGHATLAVHRFAVGGSEVEALVMRDEEGGDFVLLSGVECYLEGEQPGLYYPRPLADRQGGQR